MMKIHGHRDDDDRMRRPNIVHLQPNVIARLMGMDAPAVAAKPAARAAQFQAQRRQTNKRSLPQVPYHYSYDPGSSSRICLHKMMAAVPRSRSSRSSSSRLRRRHPQEEELLQKMRHDLQAWQASMAPALQTSLGLQAIAQEDLRKQKMARYGFGLRLEHTKVTQQDEVTLLKNNQKNDSVAQGDGDPSSEHADADADADAAAAPAAEAQDLPSHGHTPIVLLKPATTGDGGAQKTFSLGLPKLYRDANMSMLLQEIRNRVQRELTAATATATGRGDGEPIKTPASAWAIPPLQKVTKEDRGKPRLVRSESFRAFRKDRKRNASPEEAYIAKSQTSLSPEKAHDVESMTGASALSSVLRPGVGVADGQSFRSECLTMTKHTDDDATAASASPSPRLLFRSFSAPESGFALSLGRLFSFKQHEPAAVTVTRKSVVSAAGFSSFIRGMRRHGFSSTRNLMMFRKKTHWSWSNNNKTASLGAGDIHPAKMEVPICAAITPPSHETFNLFKVAQANLSELPPSPVSPLEVAAGHSSHHFFTDLHFTLPPELSPKCLSSEFEPPATASESSFRTDITGAVEAAWSRDKAYITELLIAAGLHDDDGPSSANAMARPMPICDDVFEDVEDLYYYRGDYIIGGSMHDGTDHRMLFDLANEALQSLVVESSLRRWVVDSTGVARGKKLVDDVWQQMQALRNNPQAQEMQTIEGMVAYEVRRCVWAAPVLYEDAYVVGRKIERAIFDELIQDFLTF